MAAYGEFARLYDSLMGDFDYPAWAGHYLELLALAGVRPASLADCACGTGAMTIEFARAGVSRLTGVDISEEMLSVAQEKARRAGLKIPFVKQDMARLTLPRRVDAIVAGCDGVNYLTKRVQLDAFFERAHAQLKDGGALAFDVSTEHKLSAVLGDGFFGEERADVAYLWWNRWDDEARTVTMELTFFVREEDGRYRRFEERHVQRAWTADELRAALERAGFSDIRFYGEYRLDPPKHDDARMHVTAVRAFGGNR